MFLLSSANFYQLVLFLSPPINKEDKLKGFRLAINYFIRTSFHDTVISLLYHHLAKANHFEQS